jgi:predicted nucleic acid-binding protein
MKTVYWDACVFHAVFGKEAGRVETCQRIEKAAQEGGVEIYTSATTFVECVWVKYFSHSFIRLINCDRVIGESARQLLWHHQNLHPKDAIHVASAISQPIQFMHTYDEALLS